MTELKNKLPKADAVTISQQLNRMSQFRSGPESVFTIASFSEIGWGDYKGARNFIKPSRDFSPSHRNPSAKVGKRHGCRPCRPKHPRAYGAATRGYACGMINIGASLRLPRTRTPPDAGNSLNPTAILGPEVEKY
jgi:hypothetical protein